MVESIRVRAYKLYRLDWLKHHNFNMYDIVNVAEEWGQSNEGKAPDCSFFEYLEERGLNGTIWVCFKEFLMYEYQDKQYMKHLLSPAEYREYMVDRRRNKKKAKVLSKG